MQEDRTSQAVELKLQGLSYKEIGKALGVSRQRAQQLVRPPKAIYDHVRQLADFHCQDCGIGTKTGHVHHVGNEGENYNDINNLKYLCASCHRMRHTGTIGHKCNRCAYEWKGKRKVRNCPKCKAVIKFHCDDCGSGYTYLSGINIVCRRCGHESPREKEA